MDRFIDGIPKAELHLHIEGTFEPELMFEIASKNKIVLNYKNVDEIRKAYQFNNLQEFLDIYYAGAASLVQEEDYYLLTKEYLLKARQQNIIHTEIFFDPQTHTSRGISFKTVVNGIWKALKEEEAKSGMSSRLIMCFLRHLDEQSAFETLEQARPYLDKIYGVGLDSSEKGNPPEKFQKVFELAGKMKLIRVAHAGEEGPASYISGAVKYLNISRIDHGNRALDDPALLKELKDKQIPLTLCPLSNLKLQVVKNLETHPLKKLMNAGLLITVNSDDPAYFGGYINDNYKSIQKALKLQKDDIVILAKNSIKASFISEEQKTIMLKKIDIYVEKYGKIEL